MDNLFSIAERFGTPCFVFDEVQLARRMKAVRAIVPEDIRLCYSIKANPFLIPAMRRLVGTLEVCSPGELEICRQQGVSPDMVLFSGVNKTKADVERAMDLGVTHFTCESPLHIRLIDELAAAFAPGHHGAVDHGRFHLPEVGRHDAKHEHHLCDILVGPQSQGHGRGVQHIVLLGVQAVRQHTVLAPAEVGLVAVSYTHLTLPTNREV